VKAKDSLLPRIFPNDDDDDDVYFKKNYNKGVTKSNPTQKCRSAKGISKRVNIQIINDTDITYLHTKDSISNHPASIQELNTHHELNNPLYL
jgi:hypothetical protein